MACRQRDGTIRQRIQPIHVLEEYVPRDDLSAMSCKKLQSDLPT